MKRHQESHLDHELTNDQIAYIFDLFKDRSEFFVETINLPYELGQVPCYLYGPTMGDEPVLEDEVQYKRRGERSWNTRQVERPSRLTRLVTVVAGPHDGEPCILYTAFGGPSAPQELGDPNCKDGEASFRFWKEHALGWEPSAPGEQGK
jgi:hypothetical protein